MMADLGLFFCNFELTFRNWADVHEQYEEGGKMYLEFSRTVAFITSMLLAIGMYAQVIKIFRTKSAQDFTIVLILALFADEIAWLNYGIAINEWPVYLLGGVSLPAAVLALVGYLKYGRGGERG